MKYAANNLISIEQKVSPSSYRHSNVLHQNTPMGALYKIDSFSCFVGKPIHSIYVSPKSQSNTHKVNNLQGNADLLSPNSILKRKSDFSENQKVSQEVIARLSSPSGKQIKEFIERKSISSILGINHLPTNGEVSERKTFQRLSQFQSDQEGDFPTLGGSKIGLNPFREVKKEKFCNPKTSISLRLSTMLKRKQNSEIANNSVFPRYYNDLDENHRDLNIIYKKMDDVNGEEKNENKKTRLNSCSNFSNFKSGRKVKSLKTEIDHLVYTKQNMQGQIDRNVEFKKGISQNYPNIASSIGQIMKSSKLENTPKINMEHASREDLQSRRYKSTSHLDRFVKDIDFSQNEKPMFLKNNTSLSGLPAPFIQKANHEKINSKPEQHQPQQEPLFCNSISSFLHLSPAQKQKSATSFNYQFNEQISSYLKLSVNCQRKPSPNKLVSSNDPIIQLVSNEITPQRKVTKMTRINKEMDLKSYTKAINELTKAQYEESKYMFDPNAERIKKKRRAKDKLKKVLLRCAKLGISSKNIEVVSMLSTVPYQNNGSFVFIESAKKNYISGMIRQLEKNRHYVSDFDQFRMTALHHACKKGYLDITKMLIERGADVDAVDSMNRSPLFYALITENKELIKELICSNCSPWSGDAFSFFKRNLPLDIKNILKWAKGANIICKLTRNLSDRSKIWKAQCEFLRKL